MYDWQWRIIWLNADVFLKGIAITVSLTVLCVFFGTALGVLLACCRRSKIEVLSMLSRIFIELFRALPILVVLIWIYYVLPTLFGPRLSPFAAAVLALSLNLAAFAAETVRAGIESVAHSQLESGLALGMTESQAMRRIVLPQAVRTMIPNLLGLYITEIKNSSLASIIAVGEVLHQANLLISDIYRPLEIYTTVALVYLLIILPLIGLLRYAEQRFARGTSTAFNYGTSY